jgi:hypothetical protein
MAAERTAALFEVTDEDIQKCVGAFILELSTHVRAYGMSMAKTMDFRHRLAAEDGQHVSNTHIYHSSCPRH